MTTQEIYYYILHNDLETVKEFLDELPANNTTLDKLDSLIAYAVQKNKPDMVKLLACYHADPETFNNIVLFYGEQYGNYTIREFLKNGLNPNCDCNDE